MSCDKMLSSRAVPSWAGSRDCKSLSCVVYVGVVDMLPVSFRRRPQLPEAVGKVCLSQ